MTLGSPTEVTEFPFGRFEVYSVGGRQIGRATYEAGWRWSEHVAPLVGTQLCQTPHIGLVLSGRAAVAMSDGADLVLAERDFFSIPPGHDSWVLGDEPYVSLHLLGATTYARDRQNLPKGSDRKTQPVVSKQTVPRIAWRDDYDGWTLANRPDLHVIEQRMPPGTFELRHVHEQTEQFYYVLQGEATVELDGRREQVRAGEGIEIPAGAAYQMRNDSTSPLEFLVASSHPSRQDRIDI